MDIKCKEKFLELWEKYFGNTELPFVFYYHNEIGNAQLIRTPEMVVELQKKSETEITDK